jgi:hypothetical protein
MASTTFSGPVTSTGGFVGDITGAVTGAVTGAGTLNTVATSGTLNSADAGFTQVLGVATGATVTLPAATGTGNIYRFFVGTTVTSNDYIIQVANATDVMAGVAIVANDTDASASIFETAADSDTITLDGSTTGGILGQIITIQDMASGVFSVVSTGAATGTEATPFSAAVS